MRLSKQGMDIFQDFSLSDGKKKKLAFTEMGRIHWNVERRLWVHFEHDKYEMCLWLLGDYFVSKLDIQF